MGQSLFSLFDLLLSNHIFFTNMQIYNKQQPLSLNDNMNKDNVFCKA